MHTLSHICKHTFHMHVGPTVASVATGVFFDVLALDYNYPSHILTDRAWHIHSISFGV